MANLDDGQIHVLKNIKHQYNYECTKNNQECKFGPFYMESVNINKNNKYWLEDTSCAQQPVQQVNQAYSYSHHIKTQNNKHLAYKIKLTSETGTEVESDRMLQYLGHNIRWFVWSALTFFTCLFFSEISHFATPVQLFSWIHHKNKNNLGHHMV